MKGFLLSIGFIFLFSAVKAQEIDSTNYHFYNEVQGKLKQGNKAYSFNYLNEKGQSVKLEDYRGKVVFLDFWASYCAYCVSQIPEITALQEKYPQIEVIRISVDDRQQAWKAASQRHGISGNNLWAGGMTYPADKYTLELFYFEASKTNNTPASFELSNPIPGYVLIDQKGKIVMNWAPEPGTPELNQMIEDLLN